MIRIGYNKLCDFVIDKHMKRDLREKAEIESVKYAITHWKI